MKNSDFINFIIRYLGKRFSINEACRSGATQESKFFEFEGDFPQLSQFRPDPTSRKAERIIGIRFTRKEELAYAVFSLLSLEDQVIILLHPLYCRNHNPSTGSPYTHKDCSELLGIEFDEYLENRKKALKQCQVILRKNTISSG